MGISLHKTQGKDSKCISVQICSERLEHSLQCQHKEMKESTTIITELKNAQLKKLIFPRKLHQQHHQACPSNPWKSTKPKYTEHQNHTQDCQTCYLNLVNKRSLYLVLLLQLTATTCKYKTTRVYRLSSLITVI